MIWIRSPLAAGIRRPRHGFRLGRQPISLYQLSLAGIVGDGDAREDVVKGQVITCDQPPSARSRSLHRAGVTAAPNGLSARKHDPAQGSTPLFRQDQGSQIQLAIASPPTYASTFSRCAARACRFAPGDTARGLNRSARACFVDRLNHRLARNSQDHGHGYRDDAREVRERYRGRRARRSSRTV